MLLIIYILRHFIKRRDAKTRRTIFEEAKFTEFYAPFAFSKLKTLRFYASAFDNILRFSHHRQEFIFVHYRNIQIYYDSPTIAKNSSSFIIGIFKAWAFSNLLGPILPPAKMKLVFFEILPTFLPPCFSIIALYSSRE